MSTYQGHTIPLGLAVFVAIGTLNVFEAAACAGEKSSPCVAVVERQVTESISPFHKAIYANTNGNRLISDRHQSDDNGKMWQPLRSHAKLFEGLPHGYRRGPTTGMLDEKDNRVLWIVNSLDTPELDPKIAEPPIAQQTYYLRYRVSTDGGRTWLCDDPIIGQGNFNAQHPFEDLWVGKNAIYLGDLGSRPITTRGGRILVPAQMTVLDSSGSLYKPPKAHTYTEAVVLIGQWTEDHRITWRMSQRVKGDETLSCRGMIEPTLAELPDGRLVMVMRGSNSHDKNIPARRWISISNDQGETWSDPRPWGYDDGSSFYSPSSMSSLIRHSSGRIFWVGNISPENAFGNAPRFPLVIGEVDLKSLQLIRGSLVTLDDQSEADRQRGRLDLSHVHLLEDRLTGELIVSYVRGINSYKSREYALVRLALSTP